MIFVDSNVPMYLVGAAHPHKADAQQALERLVSARERLSARDALHVAIMERHRIGTILSFDDGFDGLPGIERLPISR